MRGTSGRRFPAARREPLLETVGGRQVADPYRWLEDPESAETARWLAEQDRLLGAERRAWRCAAPLREDLQRLAGYAETSPPARRCGVTFTYQRDGDRHTIGAGDGGRSWLVVDTDVIDPSRRTTIEAWAASPDGRHIACELCVGGAEHHTLRVIDVEDATDAVPPVPLGRYADIVWIANSALYHTMAIDGRGETVRVLRLGTSDDPPLEVLGPVRGETTTFELAVSVNGRWVVAIAGDGLADDSEVWLADTARDVTEPSWQRVPALDGAASVWPADDGALLAITYDGSSRGRLVSLPAASALDGSRSLTTVVAEHPRHLLDGFVVVQAKAPRRHEIVVLWDTGGFNSLTRHDSASGELLGEVPLPGHGVVLDVAADAGEPSIWFTYSSPTTPPALYAYHLGAAECVVWSGAPSDSVAGVRVEESAYASVDGVLVPLIVLRPDDDTEIPRPTIVQSYGAFGQSGSAAYYPVAVAWVRAGGVFAIAGVRGGGERGEQWHESGARGGKQRGIDDLIAAVEHLQRCGICVPETTGLLGQSAGGLLTAAAVTQRPHLIAAAACIAPLTDMARYEMSGLGTLWTDEFGTRDVPEELDWLLGYSPYHRVVEGVRYPAVLLLTGEEDQRVDPLHARKMCAALQYATSSDRPVLLRTDAATAHGHGAREPRLAAFAEALAFLGHQTGLDDVRPRAESGRARGATALAAGRR